MTLFLACNDVFQTCTPPDEYFDYGLWMPIDDLSSGGRRQEFGSLSQAPPHSQKQSQAGAEKKLPPPLPSKVQPNDPGLKEFEAKFGPAASTVQIAENLRKEGLAPSMKDLNTLHTQLKNKVSFRDYLAFKQQIQYDDSPDSVSEFFRHFDTSGGGILKREQLKNMLMNYGECLTEEEAEAILREMKCGDEFSYADFVARLLK